MMARPSIGSTLSYPYHSSLSMYTLISHPCYHSLFLKDFGAIRGARDVIGQFASSDKGDYDTGADNHGEDEAVGRVPVGSPAEA
jgi:hypothetical protein